VGIIDNFLYPVLEGFKRRYESDGQFDLYLGRTDNESFHVWLTSITRARFERCNDTFWPVEIGWKVQQK
jgi:hypothetical protein